MNRVEELEKEIDGLPEAEFWHLTDRLIARRNDLWDREMERDAAAGRLDRLWAEAEREIEEGKTETLDEFLGHQKLSE